MEKIKCPHCPKTFKNRAGLGGHMRTHEVSKPKERIVKRRYKRREVAPVEPKSSRSLKWCPCCGLHLEVVGVALEMAS